jgi:hypothetical protein
MLAAALDFGLLIIVVMCFTQLLCGSSAAKATSRLPNETPQK